ncbi:Crp/Fnr family transcriptional regulator [Cytobacillus sp. Hz8]|uniref:Crp/Fnr family transcriptional regulator n=1 Tax=Cytobacillus sp. Hz8 TaxID=3347168 RepID=UPI0035E0470B
MEDILQAIDQSSEPQRTYLKQLFKHIPISSRSCHFLEIEEDTKFISANEPCNEVWILIEGRVRATEEQISGDVYAFIDFQAPELFGEMEGLAGIPYYRVTLMTITNCKFLIMPLHHYLNWIRKDSEALFLRARAITSRTLEESKNNHTYLFLDGMNRLMLYLIQYYRKFEKNKMCVMQIKRQQMADETGFSTKTVNRTIKKLSDQGLITVDKRKITITERQYEQLSALMDQRINY